MGIKTQLLKICSYCLNHNKFAKDFNILNY